MASNPIDCIKAHAPHLVDAFNKSKGDRQSATDLALKEFEKLHGEMENFKKLINPKYAKKEFVLPDNSKRIKEIEDEYQAKINEANIPIPEQVEPKKESGVVEDVKTEGEGTGKPPPDNKKVEPVEGDGGVPPIKVVETNLDADGNPLSGIKKALVSDKIIEGVDLEKVGDKVGGVLVGVTDKAGKDQFPAQRVFTLKQSDGTLMNVGISLMKDYVIGRANSAKLGDILGFQFTKEIPPAKKGLNPAKSIEVFVKHIEQSDESSLDF